jgi:hypothetical protein
MDEDDEKTPADWATLPYEVLIHLKGSLDDGVDAMVQLLGEDAVNSGKLHVKVEVRMDNNEDSAATTRRKRRGAEGTYLNSSYSPSH